MSSMTSNGAGKDAFEGQITETRQPARVSAWASCQTRRSRGTGRFSTTMTQDRIRCGTTTLSMWDWTDWVFQPRIETDAAEEPGPHGTASAFAAEPSADADVVEAERHHGLDRIDVAQVDQNRARQRGLDAVKVEGAEFVPFGDHHRGV